MGAFIRPLFLTGLSICFLHCEARAESSSVFDLSLEELQNIAVETASKRPQKLIETPADVIVIRKEQINARGYRHLGDLLEDLPNVDVFKNVAEEAKTLVGIRGNAGNNKFIILKNGQRLNPPTGEQLPVDFNYPLFDADRVEIVYGPASALYGADAFTGIINIVTTNISESNGVDLKASYGSDDYYYGHTYVGGKLTEKLSIELATHIHQSDNPDLSKEYSEEVFLGPLVDFSGQPNSLVRDDKYSNDTRSQMLDLRLKFEDQWTFGWNQRTFTQKSANGQLPNTTIYGPDYKTNVQLIFGEYKGDISENVQSRTNISYMISEIDPDSGYNNIFSNYERTWKYGNNQIATLVQEFLVTVTESQHLVAGFTGSYTHSLPQTTDLPFRADPDIALEDQGYTYPGTDLPITFYDVNSRELGMYAQLQSEWTPQLQTTLGARFDNDSRYGESFNPRIGLVYMPSTQGTAKILYGESFRAPPSVSAYGNFGTFTGTDPETGKPLAEFYHVPNPDLAPEKARTLEFNYGHLLDPDFLISSSVFSTWVEDLINESGVQFGRTEFAGGVIDGVIESAVNEGTAQFYGGSVGFNLRKDIDWLKVDSFLSYSYTDGVLEQGGIDEKPSYLVPHAVKGGITLMRAGYSVTPRFRYNSGAYLIRSDETGVAQRYQSPSYTVFDLTIRVADIVKGCSLSLDARNIFDRKYFGPGGRFANNYINSPQDSRVVMFSVNYLW